MKRTVPFIIIVLVCTLLLLYGCSKKEDPPHAAVPSITSISVESAAPGDTITLTGSNFSTIASGNTVTFNGVAVTVVQATTNSLMVVIPAGISSGSVTVSVTVNGQAGSYVFTYSRLAMVTTIAGSGIAGFADGKGNLASFNNPEGIAVDASGNLFVCDKANQRIRKITADGTVSTFAGSGIRGKDDGPGTSATFREPTGIVIDPSSGNLYVTEDAGTVRKITPGGMVTTFAGGGAIICNTTCSSGDDVGTAANIENPKGITIDAAGNLYLVDRYRIRKITPGAVVTTIIGKRNQQATNGNGDGAAGNALLSSFVHGIVASGSDLFFTDGVNYTVRKVTGMATVSTFVGNPSSFASIDGTGQNASFGIPGGMVRNNLGDIYVCDEWFQAIRKITAAGVVTSIVKGGRGYRDGNGKDALFLVPKGIAIDATGNLYITDQSNQRIRKITL